MPADAATPEGIAALTRRLAAGDEAAFREFHAQYFDRLYQFLLVVARGREHEAREALQETLVNVARHARPFEEEIVFWCWLKAVARNAARDAGRKRSRYAALLQNFALGFPIESPSRPPQEAERLRALIEEGLNELDAADRQLVLGKYGEGATVRELAMQTGISEKALETRLLRLRRRVRELLLKKLQSP
jgi:RNA polymerase sigma-70 factor (ECF subfamily)